ncbi:MAG: HupE/UreJ family protein [Gammaproteobacteria bacterium]
MRHFRTSLPGIYFFVAGLLAPVRAFAHDGASLPYGSFMGGLTHPVLGLDHFLAMVSVGVLSAQIGGRAIWTVPTTFVGIMAVGGVLGFVDVGLTAMELGIAISVLVLGIAAGQATSFFVLSADPMSARIHRFVPAAYVTLIAMFSAFSFYPPKFFLFENFACYAYTGEYGILDDYRPYRIFTKVDDGGAVQDGIGVNYCATDRADTAAVLPDRDV